MHRGERINKEEIRQKREREREREKRRNKGKRPCMYRGIEPSRAESAAGVWLAPLLAWHAFKVAPRAAVAFWLIGGEENGAILMLLSDYQTLLR